MFFRILAKFHARVTKSKTSFKVVAKLDEGIEWLQAKMIEDGKLTN